MIKILYAAFIISLLSSCYVYRAYEPPKEINQETGKVIPQPPVKLEELDIKTIVEPNKYYKITSEEHEFKVQAEKWEADTLVVHIKGKPHKQMRFTKENIKEVKVRNFSKSRSDAITIGSYISAAVLLILLLK